MTLGGNRNFRDFLKEYDLLETSMELRYKSVACNYYATMLLAQVTGRPLNCSKPDIEQGRREAVFQEYQVFENLAENEIET